MNGHECSEVLLSELDSSYRLDAEYYQKLHLQYKSIIESIKHDTLGYLANFLIGPFGSAYDTRNYVDFSEYRYVRGQDVKPFELQRTSAKYMVKEDYDRLIKYALCPGDLLVSVVGTIGNTCIVREKDIPGIFSCKSTVIRTKRINPYYLTCYLNSKYGHNLLLRQERGAIQKGLNLEDLKVIPVPEFSNRFYKLCETLINTVDNLHDKSRLLYESAENILMDELNINISSITNSGIAIKSFAQSYGTTARLDAEYYQPKYDDFENHVLSYKNGYTTPGKEFELVKDKCIGDLSEYAYVEIGDIDIGTGKATYNIVQTEDLPTNAKIMTQLNDLIVSTVRPYRGAVAILHENNLLVSNAFTVLRERTKYPVQTLQVLLRTKLYKDWLLKYNVGTSYPVIKNEDILNIPIPILEESIHDKIRKCITSSQNTLERATSLLECAKSAVEMAIETGENSAITWLESKIKGLT